MKHYPRLEAFRVEKDEISSRLEQFHLEIGYFTDWPSQSGKTLRNLTGTSIKLILHEGGACTLTGRDARLTLTPGCVVAVPPFTVYSAQTGEGTHAYELFFNVRPITREQEFLACCGLDGIRFFPDLCGPEDFAALARCYAALARREPGAYLALRARLSGLIARLVRAQGERPAPAPSAPAEQLLIERVFAYLNEHLSESVRVEQLCAAMRVSQSHLYRCSRDVMNCSPSQLIARVKLSRAKSLLRDADLTVADVAAAVGYDPYYFSAQFKKQFLISPSEYRKAYTRGSDG